ncbi:MAG: GDSL-type esterase/lipase family protein [Verrucomicrobia bacterium]|nr:GDSL-type esterase/lipase family protein [Verrucomicrobiota bacterium]
MRKSRACVIWPLVRQSTHSYAEGYPYQAARRLKVDVLNKGLSGSCRYLSRRRWTFWPMKTSGTFASLELGVNMRELFTPEEFAQRSRYLVKTLRAAKPNAPLFLITHFTNRDHFSESEDGAKTRANQQAFDAHIRQLATDYRDDNVYLIEGRDVLTDFTGLSADLLHPSAHGHMIMGENLARVMQPIVGRM